MSSLFKKILPPSSLKLCSKPLSKNKTSVFFSTTNLINQKQSLKNRFSSVKTYSSNQFLKSPVKFGSNTFVVSKILISSRKFRTLKYKPFFAKPLNLAFSGCYAAQFAQKRSSEGGSKGLASLIQHMPLKGRGPKGQGLVHKKTSSSIKCKSFSSFAKYLKKENIIQNLEGYKIQKQSIKYQIPIRNVCKIFIIYVCGSFCWLYLITYSNSRKSLFTSQKFNFFFQEIVFKNLPLFQKGETSSTKETLDNITLINRNDKILKDKTSFLNVERNGTLVNLQLSSVFRDFSTQNYRGSFTQKFDDKKKCSLVQTLGQSSDLLIDVVPQNALHHAHRALAPFTNKVSTYGQQKSQANFRINTSIESSDTGKIQSNSSNSFLSTSCFKTFKEMQRSNLLKKRFIFLNKKSSSNNLYYSKKNLNNKSSTAKETNLFFQEKNLIPVAYLKPKTPELAFFGRKPLFILSNLDCCKVETAIALLSRKSTHRKVTGYEGSPHNLSALASQNSRYVCTLTEDPKVIGADSPFQQNQILPQKEQYFYSGTSLVMSPDFDFLPKKLEHINKKRSNPFSLSINFLPKLEQIEKLKWCNYFNPFVTNSYLYTNLNYKYTFNLFLGKILNNSKSVKKGVNLNLMFKNPQLSTSLYSGLRKIDLKLLKSFALFSPKNLSRKALAEFDPNLILGAHVNSDRSFNLHEIYQLIQFATKEKNTLILKNKGKKIEEKNTERLILRKFILGANLVGEGSKTTSRGKAYREANQTQKKVINKVQSYTDLYINSRLHSGFNFPDTSIINNAKRNKFKEGILLRIKKDSRSKNLNYIIPTASISSLLESGKSIQEQKNKKLGEPFQSKSYVNIAEPKDSFEVLPLSDSKSKGQRSFTKGWSFDTRLGPKAKRKGEEIHQSLVPKISFIKILYEKKPIKEYISYKPSQKAKDGGNTRKVPLELISNSRAFTSPQQAVQLKNKNISEFFAKSSGSHFKELWNVTSNTDIQKKNPNKNKKEFDKKNKKRFFGRSAQDYIEALRNISSEFWKNHNFAYFVILDKNADIKIKDSFLPKSTLEKPPTNLKTKCSSSQLFGNEESFHGLKNKNAPESFFGVPYLQLGERFTIEQIKGKSQIGTFYSVHSGSSFTNLAKPVFPFASMGTSLKTIFGKKLLKQQPSKKNKTQNLVTNARLVSNWSVVQFAENKHKYNMFNNSLFSTFAKNNLSESPKGLSYSEKQQEPLSFTEQTKNLLYLKRISGKANSHLINPFKYYNPGTKRERNIEDTMLTLEGYKKSRLFPKIHVYFKGISSKALPINEKLYNTSANLDLDLQSILGGMRQRTEVERKADNFIQTRAFNNNREQENNLDNAHFGSALLEQPFDTSYYEDQNLKTKHRESVDSTEKTKEHLKVLPGDVPPATQAPFLTGWNLEGTENKDLETRAAFQGHDVLGFVPNKEAHLLKGQEGLASKRGPVDPKHGQGPWQEETHQGAKVLSFEARARQKKRKSLKKKLRFTNCYPLRTILSVGSQKEFSQTLKPRDISIAPDTSEYFFPSLSNCFSTKSETDQIKNSSETKGFYFEKLANNNTLGVYRKKQFWPKFFGPYSPWIKPWSKDSKIYGPNVLLDHSSKNFSKMYLTHLTTQLHFWSYACYAVVAGYFSKIVFFGIIWSSYKILASQLTHSTQFLPAVFTEAIGLQSFQKKYRIISPKKTKQSFKNLAGAEKNLAELRDLIWTFGLVGTGGPRGEHSYLSSFSYLGRTAGQRRNSVFSKDRNRFLLVGPPGTGKTLLVKALAKEANVPIIVQPVSQLRMITGVENPISTLFHVARQIKPCILFLDELDTLGNDVKVSNSTGEQKGNNAQWANLARKYTYTLLLELDGLTSSTRDLLIIGATNRPETLNPALTRAGRFETIINCNLPSQKQRFSVLSLYLSFLNKKKFKTTNITAHKTVKDNQNFYVNYLAKKSYGLSQASIGTAVNESAMDSILNQSSSHRLKSLEKAIESVKTLSSCPDGAKPLNFSNFVNPFVPVINFNSLWKDFAYKIVKKGPKLSKTFSNYNLNVKIWPFLVYMSYQTTGSLVVFSKLSKSNIVLKKKTHPQKQKNKVSNFPDNKINRDNLLTRRALIRQNIISKRFSINNKNKTTGSYEKESTKVSNYHKKQIFQINQSLKNKESISPSLNNKINFEISLYKRYAPIASTNLYSSIRPQSFKLSKTFGLYKNPIAVATNLLILNYLTKFVNSKESSYKTFALSPEQDGLLISRASRFVFDLGKSNSSADKEAIGCRPGGAKATPVQSKIKNIPVSKLSPQFISQNSFFKHQEKQSKASPKLSLAQDAKTSANISLFKKNRENKNSFRFQEELSRQIKLSKPLTTSWFRIYLSRPIFRYEVGEYIENREYYPQNNYNLICQSLHFANLAFLAHRIYTPQSYPLNQTKVLQQKGKTETFSIGQNLKKEFDDIPIEFTLYLAIVASIFHKVSLFIGKNRELLDYCVYNNLRYGTLYDFSINQICKKF